MAKLPSIWTVHASETTVEAAKNTVLKSPEYGSVLFGSYPQTAEGERQPIEWLVLKREEDKALLLSRCVLDAKPYNAKLTSMIWAGCDLRGWLNGSGNEDFPQAAFTAEERERILPTRVSADNNPLFPTRPGPPTEEKLFLLSIPEAMDLFPSDDARRCAPTDYAKKQGAYTNMDDKAEGKPACWWWLRTPGGNPRCAAFVFTDGSFIEGGIDVIDGTVGVRPAMWVKL